MGMMAMMLVRMSEVSGLSVTARMVFSRATGKPTHAAWLKAAKSTLPKQAARPKDAITPSKMGTMRTMPLPHMLLTMTTTMATKAMSQSVVMLEMAVPERQSPIDTTMGPVTTGGKYLSTLVEPNHLMSAAMMK